jgi:hypothetical protein
LYVERIRRGIVTIGGEWERERKRKRKRKRKRT